MQVAFYSGQHLTLGGRPAAAAAAAAATVAVVVVVAAVIAAIASAAVGGCLTLQGKSFFSPRASGRWIGRAIDHMASIKNRH